MGKRKTKTKAQQKARKAKFNQNKKSQSNQIKKMQQAYMNQMIERQEIMKRANIVEQIYKARPEIATEIEGKLQIDDTVVTEKEDVLYWTKDDNPVMAGLESFENYTKYSKEFVNQVLEVIQHQGEKVVDEETTSVDLAGFDLVEDENIELVESTETSEKTDSK